MKLYGKDGTIYIAHFDAETLYDLSVGLMQASKDAIVILRVRTLSGLAMTIHMTELDLDKTFEEQVCENHPPLQDEEIKDYRILALYGLQ